MNRYGICDRCKAVNSKSLIDKIKKIDKNAQFFIGCQNFCGIGKTDNFAIVNNIPVIAPTEDELISKIKELIQK